MKTNDKQLVVKANKLIEASYYLTLNEQRLILLAITKVRRDSALYTHDEFVISAEDWISIFQVEPKNAYRDLQAISRQLFERYITIESTRGNPLVTRWISSIEYLAKDGKLVITFAQNILPFLTVLEKEFTKYRLEFVSKMTSIYAVRLYELLVQWNSTGTREIELDWLKKTFQITETYAEIRNFKARVIEPAITQINSHSDLTVSYTQRKTGRLVTHFTFVFSPKAAVEPKPRAKKKSPPKETLHGLLKADIERLARAGESYEQAAERIKKQGLI
ncbi:MAG: replication initiation protein [Agitococcus sp.]|jgi:plasmid replication initiation protein|nr:replication initiation protein [Agitococcus sp.]